MTGVRIIPIIIFIESSKGQTFFELSDDCHKSPEPDFCHIGHSGQTRFAAVISHRENEKPAFAPLIIDFQYCFSL